MPQVSVGLGIARHRDSGLECRLRRHKLATGALDDVTHIATPSTSCQLVTAKL